jgi:hypothetical protein
MDQVKLDRGIDKRFVRRGKLALLTVLLSAALTACGGDSDSPAAPAASAPPLTQTPSNASGGLVATPPTNAAAKGTTTLSWTPPTSYDDGTPLTLTGYKIYWGGTEGHYPHSVTLDNPGLTRYVVEQLAAGTWYFVATALSTDGESPPSNVVKMQVN